MKKFSISLITMLSLASVAFAADSQIWGKVIVPNILAYGKEGTSGLGLLFTQLQSLYFPNIFAVVLIAVPLLFFGHYLIWGPKVFSHDGEKIFIFPLFQRLVHLLAVIAFLLLVPTGIMIIYGKYLGGGALVVTARHIHGIATLIFLLSVIPMTITWFKDMLPTADDIRWSLMLGGYLDKRIKEIPAGKFNGGQKMWFWCATVGGAVMIFTGAAMFFQVRFTGVADFFALSQIDFLRLCAMTHTCLAMATVAFFFTHVYMSLFAIKGAVHSIINGYKPRDEVRYLHSSYYKKLKKEGKI